MDKKQLGFVFLFIIIFLLAAKFYTVTADFLPPVAAACVLAYIFNPVYRYLAKVTRREGVAAVLVIVIYVALILVPLTLIIISVQNQLQSAGTQELVDKMTGGLKGLLAVLRERYGIELSAGLFTEQLPDLLSKGQNAITSLVSKLIVGVTGFAISVFLTVFIMFYLLTSGDVVLETIRRYFPLSDKNFGILLHEMASQTRVLILGQLIVAILQGTLAALGFLIFGVGGVLIWGMVMAILSFIPFLGSFLIWLPAAIILILEGEYFNGIGLIIWGSTVVGLSDNFLRPKLTSTLGEIHPVTVLLGVFIGLKEWGFIGLVLGPLIITVLLVLIRMFRREYIEGELAQPAEQDGGD